MFKGTSGQAWIKPKINRPSLSPDYLPRPHLLNELNAKRNASLTVIVGPAGYGKTTLLVAWLSGLDWPSVWVSLDSSDNTLYSFVSYIVAAIQKHFPGALEETSDLLQSVVLPEENVLSHALINDLEQIETPFVLTLDDYHLIREPAIHTLVKALLRYPSSTFHLAIATRHDPPLPLSTMRAKGLVNEVRIEDLRFNNDEAAGLLKRMTGMDLSVSSIEMLTEQMDGWAAGLYVAGLTLRRKPDMLSMKPGMVNAASEAMAYLFDDVLLQQPLPVQTFLLRTSVLEEFDQSLCAAVAGEDCATYEGQSCLDYLVERNLFLARTGEKENVYRYHHLFQTLLRTEMRRRHGEAECEALNKRASDWHVLNNQPEEALRYALRMRDFTPAVNIIAHFRHELMNNDEWQRLEDWLSLLPRQIVESSADLTVAEGYIAYMRFRVLECAACIKRMDGLLAGMMPSPEKDGLAGEAAALRAWMIFQNAGDFSDIGIWADQSLKFTPQNRWSARTIALVYAAGARIVNGDAKAGIDLVLESINDLNTQEPGYKLHLMVMACMLHGYVGDLSGQMRAALEGVRIGKAVVDAGSQEKWALHVNWSRHHLASVLYQRNELTEAEVVLRRVIEERYTAHVNCTIQSMFILAMICQAQNRGAEAIKLTELASEYALEMRSTTLLPVIKLFEINLAVQQGRIADALQWLKGHSVPEKLPHLIFAYNPFTTFVKAHLAVGTPDHLAEAEAILSRLHAHAERLHHSVRIIEMLALKALLADARQDQRAAFTHLEQALLLGQPERHVRVFADLGPRMHDLLSRYHSRHVSPKYVRRVASAVSRDSVVEGFPSQAGLLNPLTDRELEVLGLLMKRMSNKEIADALFISPGTVKHHTHVIFEKLEVHSRREAVMKALDLNLLGYQ